MDCIKDWVSTQLLSIPLSSSTSLFSAGLLSADNNNSHETEVSLGCPEPPLFVDRSQENGNNRSIPPSAESSRQSIDTLIPKGMDSLAKVEHLKIKFYRLLKRFGISAENYVVAKVLYRIHVATLIRAGESDLKRVRGDRAKVLASEQEASGRTDLKFSIRILVVGKTGAGKSSTINSILSGVKIETDAFHPATSRVHEVSGSINGAHFTFIDTPGFLPTSAANMRRNRKIMSDIRRFIKKSPPDIVFFCERIDLVSSGYSDYHIFKLMTEVFGNAIWFNTVFVLTHATSTPEGPAGYPVDYESYVSRCSDIIRSFVHQTLNDSSIENQVLLVENHSLCKKNVKGESVLPHGVVWKLDLFLLCICSKILADVNVLLDFQGSMILGPALRARAPSLPHLLSSFLQHQASSSSSVSEMFDDSVLEDANEEDYDQLPPIRILTKSQFNKMSRYQQREYLNELDYRETLFFKKQLKQDAQKRAEDERESINNGESEAVLVSDMAIPPTFDSDCPAHRYRHLLTNDKWVTRPVFDPRGWDHDVGFDGVNVEFSESVRGDIHLSTAGQMSKDKRGFSCQAECAAIYADPRRPSCSLEMELQSTPSSTVYTARGNIKVKAMKHNVADCGLSLTSYGGKAYLGAKVEDAILIGNRVKLMVNAGQMKGDQKTAAGGTVEASFRGRDYPVKNDFLALSLTALVFDKETVLNGGLKTEFRPIRGASVSVNCNLNTRKMGQVSVRMKSSEHMEIAAVALLSVVRAFLNRKAADDR